MSHITFNENNRVFHIASHGMSYIMQLFKEDYLVHLYWGKEVKNYNDSFKVGLVDRAFSPNPNAEDRTFSLDTVPLEYPAFGNTDFRTPSIRLRMKDGTHITDFRYESHKIISGKEKLVGYGQTYADKEDVETLVITLKDTLYNLYLDLSYSVFNNYPILTRHSVIRNESEDTIYIEKLSSCNIDFRNENLELIHLSGAWGNERELTRQSIEKGNFIIDSKRGSSSHHHNPFVALVDKGTNETSGNAYALNLVYSGDFSSEIEKDSKGNIRTNMGLNPFTFTWKLDSKTQFSSPEVVMVFSSSGLGSLSRDLHHFYRHHLIRGNHQHKERPILINNWEATYFNFNEEKLKNLADVSSNLGIELFVLDDGWFGKRNNDDSSLGDWFVNREKLPNGLEGISDYVHKKNMSFGIWVEPEMISVNSELYNKHPEWCLQVEGRRKSESRNQLILDLANPQVCEYIYESMDSVLTSAKIDYIKWDMNRNMTEAYSLTLPYEQKLETAHRYIMGLYDVIERLTKKHPNVLFESCSGGGGRFDPGMLYFMPQVWTSDNTDAIARLAIQNGTSMAYPAISMGAHVSAIPNHQIQRVTDLKTRGDVAMAGTFGYELDLTQCTKEEQTEISQQVKEYKKLRHIVQFGDLYRLRYENNEVSWQFISEDKTEVLVTFVKKLGMAQEPFMRLKLDGLDESSLYQLDNKIFGGDELMNIGLDIPNMDGDFKTYQIYLKKVQTLK